ncbi:MAG: hypothetical protein L6R28_14820 [Planctomycetes bacterium]|nr:hypothetical protein [Planctomycetota bacterium]
MANGSRLPDSSIPDTIRRNAELVVTSMQEKLGRKLDYDRESVAWLDEHIETVRKELPEKALPLFVSMYGSYLGCCLIKRYGGSWQQHNQQWAVVFENKNIAYPLVKMSKRFTNGREDSILAFFDEEP